jgi:hypothetical protein
MDRSKPPGTHDLRKSLCIILIGLVDLHLERSFCMPRIETRYIKPSAAQLMHEPRRQRTGLNADTVLLFGALPHSPLDLLRV